MKQPIAFASGALDRAAHLRVDDGVRQDGQSRTLVFWRGKLLVDRADKPLLVRLDHDALTNTREPPLFLGLTPTGPVFSADLSLWSPPEDAATIGEFIDQSQQVHPAWPDAKFAEIRGLMPSLSLLDGECIAAGRALIGWHGSHRFCANCGNATAPENAGWVRKCPDRKSVV